MRGGDRSVERESLLGVLIIFLGGVTLQFFAAWPWSNRKPLGSRQSERLQWLALWGPAAPTAIVASWLCGWALSQPDPVHDPVGPFIFIAGVPFGVVAIRAIARAAWSLARPPGDCGVATVGLFKPYVVFAPQLARRLDDRAIEAALAHEYAHVRHRDPLRIWVAQFATDVQWPWSSAQRRFTNWLAALELARDDEARAAGVDGEDLAAALIGSLRFQCGKSCTVGVGLIGQPDFVQARIARLLQPLPDAPRDSSRIAIPALLVLVLVLAMALGISSGESLLRPLLALST